MKESEMDLGLGGKRALVTGASSGIGEAVARLLAAEGAAVVVHGRHPERTDRVSNDIRSAGGQSAAVIGDLDRLDDATDVAERASHAFGGVDILVNNAGSAPLGAWFDLDTEDLWERNYAQNVVSATRMINRLVPPMIKAGWGRVIQISSIVAHMPQAGNAHYHASKSAVANLTVSLSKRLAATGVTVNTVSPGLVRTPATLPWMIAATAEDRRNDWESVERAAVQKLAPNLVGRIGKPEDIATAVAFLASNASGFITGANLRVDGGGNPTVN